MPTVAQYKQALDRATSAGDQEAMAYFQGQIERGMQPAAPRGNGSALDPIAQGLTLGFADEIAGGISGGLAKLQGGDYLPEYRRVRDNARQNAADYSEANPGTSLALEIGSGLALPGGLLGKLLGTGVKGAAVAGGLAGLGAGEGDVTEQLASTATGAVGGAAVGAALKGLSGIGRAIFPGVAPRAKGPQFQRDITALERVGIKPTAAERISSPQARRSEQLAQGYFGAGDEIAARPQTLMRELMGMSNFGPAAASGELSDAALNVAKANFGRDYGNIFRGVQVAPGDIIAQTQAAATKHAQLLPSEQRGQVNSLLKDFSDLLTQGQSISGEDYQRLRSTLGKRAKAVESGQDSYLAPIYREMKAGLDRAFAASVPAAKQDALKAANRQYSGYKVLEKASRAPENLNALANIAHSERGRVNPEFLKLARAYQNVLLRGANPSSGTAENIAANSLMPPLMAIIRSGGAKASAAANARGLRVPTLPPMPQITGQAGRAAAEAVTDTPEKQRARRARRYQREGLSGAAGTDLPGGDGRDRLSGDNPLLDMSPVDLLMLRREMEGRKRVTPEQARANLAQTGKDVAGALPGIGNAMSAYDAIISGRDAIKAAGEGRKGAAAGNAALSGLGVLGALSPLPWGGAAGGVAKEAGRTAGAFGGKLRPGKPSLVAAETDSPETGFRDFYLRKGDEDAAYINGIYRPDEDPTTFWIEWIKGTGDKNTLGKGDMAAIIAGIKEQYPQVTRVEGNRTTGARAKAGAKGIAAIRARDDR